MPYVPPKAAYLQVTLIGEADPLGTPELYKSIEGGGARFEFVEDVEAPPDELPRFTGRTRFDPVTLTGSPLPPRALGLLEALVAQPGAVVSKQALMDAVWKEAFVTEASLLEAIRVLREALGDDRLSPVYIQTVHRRGYRFIAPIRPMTQAAPVETTPAAAAARSAVGTVRALVRPSTTPPSPPRL